MKLSKIVVAASVVSSVGAFAPASSIRHGRQNTIRFMSSSETTDVVAESAMPDSSNAYERMGITEDQLAIGVDASEFLQWIGTKNDLVEKFKRDNKAFDDTRATEEVEKFLLDAEMVNAYIKFEKDKIVNPPNYKEEAEATLKDPKTIATYAAWLVGGASFGWVRKTIIEPKYASGEWEEVHIQLPTLPFFENQAADAAAAKAAAVVDVASAVVDNASSAGLV